MTQLSIFDEEKQYAKTTPIKNLEEIISDIVENNPCSVVHSLISLPATDGNFISALNNASMEDLNTAFNILTELNKVQKGHKSRLIAVTRRIKKLNK